MKILQSLREKIKRPSTIGFIVASVIYLSVLTFLFANFSKSITVQENGNQTVTMKLASVNSGGNETHFSKAPPKPPKKPKPKKPKPKKKHHKTPMEQPKEILKEEPIVQKQEIVDEKQKSSNIDQEGSNNEALAYNQGVNDEFLSKIRLAISNSNPYPRIARVRGLEGEVTIEFILNIDGSLEGLKILKSTAGDILNKSALRAVGDASKYFPTPKQKVRIKVPIVYSLSKS
ncbi:MULTISPECIES: energy transducer TonB [unclassified Helicobacter]|uniref:energy transducer TonB n=1 Tax=unclassified Helicobacter TaxID=2593540 RepID=UPI000CF1BB3C|nr:MULTISPECIES: energy transducer TonB [unclassified Helicobacter]